MCTLVPIVKDNLDDIATNDNHRAIAIGSLILFNVPRDTHRYLIESISQCLHVKTMLTSRCVSFHEIIKASSKLCIRFLSNLCEYNLNTVLGRTLFSINVW